MAKDPERDIIQDWIDTYGIDACIEQTTRFEVIRRDDPDQWSWMKLLMGIAMTGNSNRLARKKEG